MLKQPAFDFWRKDVIIMEGDVAHMRWPAGKKGERDEKYR